MTRHHRTAIAATLGTLLLAAVSAFAQTCATVEVDHVRAGTGHLMVAAYGSAETFGKTPVAQLRLPAAAATKMRFELCGLAGSEVALMLYQDLDGDGKLARNVVGMPTEPWGGSGKPGTFGPTWETSRVPLNGQVITVALSQ